MTPALNVPVFDLATLAGPQRHAPVFAAFDALAVGDALELHADHDPQLLQRQFNSRNGGQFNWEVLQQGPQQWRVRLSRTIAAGAACCGSCGGGRH